MGVRGEVFSNRVILQNRTYFFNVKENRMGDLYLNIVESKNRDNGGFDRQSVILFADDLQEFLKGFDESLKALEKAMREKRHSGGETNRKFGIKPGIKSGAEPDIKYGEKPGVKSRVRSGIKHDMRNDTDAGPPRARARRDEKFHREERNEKRGRRSGDGGQPPVGKPPFDRKNTKERYERGERNRYSSGGERNNRSRSGERGSDPGRKGNKRVVVRKRDRDN